MAAARCSGRWKQLLPPRQGLMFVPKTVEDEPLLLPVYELAQWEAVLVKWQSPLGQVYEGVTDELREQPWAIRARAIGEPDTLLRVAARCAFWKFGGILLSKLAAFIGAAHSPANELFDTLWSLITHVLPDMANDAVLDTISARLVCAAHSGGELYNELILADEGMVGLTPDEQKDLHKEKEQAEQRASVATSFSRSYVRKANEVRPIAVAEPCKGKGKGKGRARGAAGRGGGPPPRRLPDGELAQADLRPLVPPGSHMWISNVSGAWSGHCKPYKRISFSFALYGHRHAAILVLRGLWERHLLKEGQECPRDCPIVGLFEDAAADTVLPPGGGVGAGSSSDGVRRTR